MKRGTGVTAMASEVRVLCLGNELLADDAFGSSATEELRRRFPQINVVFTTDSGIHLIDYLTGIQPLVVVDCIQTGQVPPGTLYVLRSSDIKSAFGPSPHYIGLFETLQLARELLLDVPDDVVILAVEAADCLTLGGEMKCAVKSAIGLVADLVEEIMHQWKPAGAHRNQDSGDGLSRAIVTVSARWGTERLVVV
jgi:hydrogenase maturation protease